MTDFPSFHELPGLTSDEHQALRSMSRACQIADGERQAAYATASRLSRLSDAVEDLEPGTDGGPTSFRELTHELAGQAWDWDTAVEQITCWYVTAYTVLGITVLDRIVHGKPPLTAEQLHRLTREPSLGELRAALLIPVRDLLVRRSEVEITRQEHRRAELVDRLGSVKAAIQTWLEDTPDHVVDQARISVSGAKDTDEVWTGLLDPLIAVAEQTPYEISNHLRG
ncbi:hypothetical protein [Streptacidiphilus sp. MAP5-3]|uniref:hypothetical protein n=1 Tax=unclassified Streptacidiphilus TaxID=2643834 RepID=UPI003511D7F1